MKYETIAFLLLLLEKWFSFIKNKKKKLQDANSALILLSKNQKY
jgi:hypothetical protein